MVDIHSHILPGIDDGAQDFEQSMAMLNLAAASGTTDIVATPHADSNFHFDQAVIEDLFRELSSRAQGIINLHCGCDFHLNFDNLFDALSNPAKYTINSGRYLMVELPEIFTPSVMRGALKRLLSSQMVPVITHPERNPSVHANLRELEDWLHDGCLLQVTAQSLDGYFGPAAQRVSQTLLDSEWVHFLASDAHDCLSRPPDLSGGYQILSRRWGADRANALCIDNPQAVIANQPIFAAEPRPMKKPSVFSFWK